MFWRLTLADTQGDWVRALRGRESQLRKIWAGIPNSLLANEVSRHRYWEGVEHQWTAIERKAGIRGRGEEKTDCGTRDSWKRVGYLVPSFLQVFFFCQPLLSPEYFSCLYIKLLYIVPWFTSAIFFSFPFSGFVVFTVFLLLCYSLIFSPAVSNLPLILSHAVFSSPCYSFHFEKFDYDFFIMVFYVLLTFEYKK